MGGPLAWLPEGVLITLLTLAAGLLGWFGKTIIAGLNRNSARAAKMYELGWEQAAEKERDSLAGRLNNPTFVERAIAHTPAGRLATRAEVAELVAQLASPAFDMVTGVTLPVDGGWRFNRF